MRGYVNYLENSCSSDARLSKSDLRSKLIEGGFPKNRDVDEHIEKVRSIIEVRSLRIAAFDVILQLVPLLGAYDGMFPVSGLLTVYKNQLEFVEGEEFFEAAKGCKCVVS